MNDIYERLPALAASARNFVSQLDAPTLHDRLNKMASACDEAYEEISRLRAQVARVTTWANFKEEDMHILSYYQTKRVSVEGTTLPPFVAAKNLKPI